MQENLDLDRYPLDKPGTPAWDAMVAKAKAELAETGMFNLPGFLKPAAQRAAVGELAPRFAGESFTHARKHNVYFRKEVPGLAADHPALTLFETINKTLCGDQIGGSIKALYEWPPFAAFLAATMDKPRPECPARRVRMRPCWGAKTAWPSTCGPRLPSPAPACP